jgi:hypothetical protein
MQFVRIGEREFEVAAEAYAQYGKGHHPAELNMGDASPTPTPAPGPIGRSFCSRLVISRRQTSRLPGRPGHLTIHPQLTGRLRLERTGGKTQPGWAGLTGSVEDALAAIDLPGRTEPIRRAREAERRKPLAERATTSRGS